MTDPDTAIMKHTCLKHFFALALGIAAATPGHANFVVNGGFETGNFSGWTVSDPSLQRVVTAGSCGREGAPHSGSYFACIGSDSPRPLSQQVTGLTPGLTYALSYFLDRSGTGGTVVFIVDFGGQTLSRSVDQDDFSPYTRYSFDVVASGSTESLVFTEQSGSGYLYLDDVVLDLAQSAVAAAPEPGQVVLLLIGFVAALLARKARRQTTGSHHSPRRERSAIHLTIGA